MAGITISSVEIQLEFLLREQEELLEGLAELETRIKAFRLVIAECTPLADRVSLDLSGMSVEEALVALAENNSGELSTYQARPALIDAGLLHGEMRNVSVKLYAALSASDRFEKMGPRGRYRLLPSVETWQGTLLDAIIKVLRDKNDFMSAAEIVAALDKSGYEISGTDRHRHVSARLSAAKKQGDVVNPEQGQWGLPDWENRSSKPSPQAAPSLAEMAEEMRREGAPPAPSPRRGADGRILVL